MEWNGIHDLKELLIALHSFQVGSQVNITMFNHHHQLCQTANHIVCTHAAIVFIHNVIGDFVLPDHWQWQHQGGQAHLDDKADHIYRLLEENSASASFLQVVVIVSVRPSCCHHQTPGNTWWEPLRTSSMFLDIELHILHGLQWCHNWVDWEEQQLSVTSDCQISIHYAWSYLSEWRCISRNFLSAICLRTSLTSVNGSQNSPVFLPRKKSCSVSPDSDFGQVYSGLT